MDVYFVVLNEMMTGVIPSQIIAPARAYSSALPDLSISIIFLEPARFALGQKARARIKELRAMWPQGSMHLLPYIGRLGKFAPALSLRGWLGPRRKKIVLHCRGPEATIQGAHAAKRLGGRIIFDSRGASDHEAMLRLMVKGFDANEDDVERSRRRGFDLDKNAIECAHAATAVSEALVQKIRQVSTDTYKTISLIPCCVERMLFSSSARSAMREKLGLSESELLLISISTEIYWENFGQVIDFFREVSLRQPAKLLFLTTLSREQITAGLRTDDPVFEKIIFRQAATGEVPAYLSAADAGLLLRKPHEAHIFASPIKFAEYLAGGIAVVVSKGIGTTSEVVESRRVGVIVEESARDSGLDSFFDLIKEDRDALRQRCLQTCEQTFLWNHYVPVIKKLYGIP
jgi:glycosyltransferase involved in cell wall biosynthesis